MNGLLEQLSRIGIIPVIAIDDAEKAVPLANALSKGGLPAAEVTLRTPAAIEAIRKIARDCPNVLVGAGTVLNIEQCEKAIEAGAKYIVSPGYNTELVRYCVQRGILVLPGCVNASDMTRAVNDGLDAVKFFPAEQSGGIAGLKALAPVFPNLSFVPTGGINRDNMMNYLGYDRVAACGGSWMVKKDLIENESWEEITALSGSALKRMLGFSLKHISINCENFEDKRLSVRMFCELFNIDVSENDCSIYAGSSVEFIGEPSDGTRGHITVATNSLKRAVTYWESKGVSFANGTPECDASGKLTTVELEQKLNGFTVHLIQK